MRFHLMMLLFVVLVSLGMHGMATAMPAVAQDGVAPVDGSAVASPHAGARAARLPRMER